MKRLGRIGYFFREVVNEFHGWLVGSFAAFLCKIVDWLDNKECVTYWRKKDRGI